MFLHFCRNQILALDMSAKSIIFYHTKITVTLQYNNRSGMSAKKK